MPLKRENCGPIFVAKEGLDVYPIAPADGTAADAFELEIAAGHRPARYLLATPEREAAGELLEWCRKAAWLFQELVEEGGGHIEEDVAREWLEGFEAAIAKAEGRPA